MNSDYYKKLSEKMIKTSFLDFKEDNIHSIILFYGSC